MSEFALDELKEMPGPQSVFARNQSAQDPAQSIFPLLPGMFSCHAILPTLQVSCICETTQLDEGQRQGLERRSAGSREVLRKGL